MRLIKKKNTRKTELIIIKTRENFYRENGMILVKYLNLTRRDLERVTPHPAPIALALQLSRENTKDVYGCRAPSSCSRSKREVGGDMRR